MGIDKWYLMWIVWLGIGSWIPKCGFMNMWSGWSSNVGYLRNPDMDDTSPLETECDLWIWLTITWGIYRISCLTQTNKVLQDKTLESTVLYNEVALLLFFNINFGSNYCVRKDSLVGGNPQKIMSQLVIPSFAFTADSDSLSSSPLLL